MVNQGALSKKVENARGIQDGLACHHDNPYDLHPVHWGAHPRAADHAKQRFAPAVGADLLLHLYNGHYAADASRDRRSDFGWEGEQPAGSRQRPGRVGYSALGLGQRTPAHSPRGNSVRSDANDLRRGYGGYG